MLSFHVKFVQTDRWTERQKDNGKTIRPNLSIRGIINVAKKLKFVNGRVENIVGKGENAGQHYGLLNIENIVGKMLVTRIFILFPNVFFPFKDNFHPLGQFK